MGRDTQNQIENQLHHEQNHEGGEGGAEKLHTETETIPGAKERPSRSAQPGEFVRCRILELNAASVRVAEAHASG